MAILKEAGQLTRRQFLKGMGVLAAALVVGGVFLKTGKDAYAAHEEYIKKRAAALYANDASMPIRKSHENPEIKAIYKDFLSQPLSEKSEHLLHTHYINRYAARAS